MQQVSSGLSFLLTCILRSGRYAKPPPKPPNAVPSPRLERGTKSQAGAVSIKPCWDGMNTRVRKCNSYRFPECSLTPFQSSSDKVRDLIADIYKNNLLDMEFLKGSISHVELNGL